MLESNQSGLGFWIHPLMGVSEGAKAKITRPATNKLCAGIAEECWSGGDE